MIVKCSTWPVFVIEGESRHVSSPIDHRSSSDSKFTIIIIIRHHRGARGFTRPTKAGGIRYHLNNDKGLEIKWLQPYQAIISHKTDHDPVPCPAVIIIWGQLLDAVVCVLPASCIWLTGSQRSFCTWSSVGLRTFPPRRRAYRHPRDLFHDHGGFRGRAPQSRGHRWDRARRGHAPRHRHPCSRRIPAKNREQRFRYTYRRIWFFSVLWNGIKMTFLGTRLIKKIDFLREKMTIIVPVAKVSPRNVKNKPLRWHALTMKPYLSLSSTSNRRL